MTREYTAGIESFGCSEGHKRSANAAYNRVEHVVMVVNVSGIVASLEDSIFMLRRLLASSVNEQNVCD